MAISDYITCCKCDVKLIYDGGKDNNRQWWEERWGKEPEILCPDCEKKLEPVAWMIYTQDGQSVYVTDNPTNIQEGQKALPLYTTPPQRKPLTDEEIADLWNETVKYAPSEVRIKDFARAIEAAHNIKE